MDDGDPGGPAVDELTQGTDRGHLHDVGRLHRGNGVPQGAFRLLAGRSGDHDPVQLDGRQADRQRFGAGQRQLRDPIEHALIDTGEMQTIGPRADGDAWTVGIQHPISIIGIQGHYELDDIPFDKIVKLPLRVETRPPGAVVTVNGVERGRSPLLLSHVPAE